METFESKSVGFCLRNRDHIVSFCMFLEQQLEYTFFKRVRMCSVLSKSVLTRFVKEIELADKMYD